jgi:hypothetical protein
VSRISGTAGLDDGSSTHHTGTGDGVLTPGRSGTSTGEMLVSMFCLFGFKWPNFESKEGYIPRSLLRRMILLGKEVLGKIAGHEPTYPKKSQGKRLAVPYSVPSEISSDRVQ